MNKFGVVKMANGNEILFMAVGGSFASEAWMKSDEAFEDTLGQSFSAITADDGKQYNIGRNVRRVSVEEYNTLIQKAHPAFRVRVEIEAMPYKRGGSLSLHFEYLNALELIPYWIDKGFSVEEIIQYFKEKFGE